MDIKKKCDSNHLKLIAIIAMTFDHGADLFFPGFPLEPIPFILHFIGRITAPIMWFFVCEGFHYTIEKLTALTGDHPKKPGLGSTRTRTESKTESVISKIRICGGDFIA